MLASILCCSAIMSRQPWTTLHISHSSNHQYANCHTCAKVRFRLPENMWQFRNLFIYGQFLRRCQFLRLNSVKHPDVQQITNWKGYERQRLWSNETEYPGVCLEIMRKTRSVQSVYRPRSKPGISAKIKTRSITAGACLFVSPCSTA